MVDSKKISEHNFLLLEIYFQSYRSGISLTGKLKHITFFQLNNRDGTKEGMGISNEQRELELKWHAKDIAQNRHFENGNRDADS